MRLGLVFAHKEVEDPGAAEKRREKMERWKWAYPRLWVSLAGGFSLLALGCGVVCSSNTYWPGCAGRQRRKRRRRFENFSQPDRNVLQFLVRLKKALGEHRYGEALEGLTEILRGNEDYYCSPTARIPIYRGLKAEALELLGGMPREGRDLYEVRNGAEARERLNKAVASGSENALSEVSASSSTRRRATKPPTFSPCTTWTTARRWPAR